MNGMLRRCLCVGLVCVWTSAVAVGAPRAATSPRVDPRLQAALAALEPGATLPVWVVFNDKGVHEALKAAPPRSLVSPRSLQRRLKVRSETTVVDGADLPLEESYVAQVAARATRLRQRSKWTNRVSVEVTPAQIAAIAALPCVQHVEPLARFRKSGGDPASDGRDREEIGADGPPGSAPAGVHKPGMPTDRTADVLDYGPSRVQLEQIGITTLQAQGLDGTGVLIGHFDDGYRLLAHETFAGASIVATHDFVDGDIDPAPPLGSPADFGAHGIVTLSTLAGYTPGQLIGAAYAADYVLARTENDASETPLEEDNWVAAMEWADSLGIDVASTSLGYLTYDLPYPSWTWLDMDGNTTVITRAADRAASLGIVVVNSAGNNGLDVHNTLNAPADGDSVLAIGAVDSFDVRTNFSSVGPTTSIPARFKPDVMALGRSVTCARTTSTTDYGTASGTSLSCPLVAGVAALLIEAHPAASAMQIVEALRATASQAGSPDNLDGWGLVDAVAASAMLQPTDARLAALPPRRRLAVVPNPFNPSTMLRYALPAPARVSVLIVDARGRLVRSLTLGGRPAGDGTLSWDGRDEHGRALPSGVYLCRLVAAPEVGPHWTLDTKAVLVR